MIKLVEKTDTHFINLQKLVQNLIIIQKIKCIQLLQGILLGIIFYLMKRQLQDCNILMVPFGKRTNNNLQRSIRTIHPTALFLLNNCANIQGIGSNFLKINGVNH